LNWLKKSSKPYKVKIDGTICSLDDQGISGLIKKKLKSSQAVQKAFKKFEISPDKLDNLDIIIEDIGDDQYALTDSEKMRLNKSVFENGNDFLKDYMFVIAHEIMHFILRLRQKQKGNINLPDSIIPEKPTKSNHGYFNDEEESLAFCLAIAYELEKGKSLQEIWRLIFPKIEFHFHDEKDAKIFFKRCIKKSKQFL